MRKLFSALALVCILGAAACVHRGPQPLFAPDSFWNQPIPPNAVADPQSEAWIAMLARDQSCLNFGINATRYTIPIYDVDSETPRVVIGERSDLFRQHENFRGAPVPLPEKLAPSPGVDAHAVMYDRRAGLMWDMWKVERGADGAWRSNTGIVVDARGSGLFDPADFPLKPGESVHQYGPGRAAGVPLAAGLILHDEVASGRIRHKLAAAVRFVGYQRFVSPPAIWTDGNVEGGLPEGATLQLDPELDLAQFDLTPGERVVARALQEYGAVVVDFAAGNALYAEGLWSDPSRSWDGILREFDGGLVSIPLRHYRVLATGPLKEGGDRLKPFFRQFLDEPYLCDGAAR